MSALRDAYIKWGDRVFEIMRPATDKDILSLMPAFHKLKRVDGSEATLGDYDKFAKDAYVSKQVREIIGLLMEAEGAAK